MGLEAKIPESWTPPAELQTETPRRVRFRGAGLAAVVSALLLAMAALGIFVYANRVSHRLQVEADLLRSDSRETEGQIFQVRNVGRGASGLFEVTYNFNADGRPIGGKSMAHMSDLAGRKAGDAIRIRYFGGDPAINRPADWEPPTNAGWLGLALPGILALMAAGILYALRRQRGLLAEGVAAPAVITSVTAVKSGWIAGYECRPADGMVSKGVLARNAKPEIGGVVPVLYDPAKPSRKTTYPSNWYRIGE